MQALTLMLSPTEPPRILPFRSPSQYCNKLYCFQTAIAALHANSTLEREYMCIFLVIIFVLGLCCQNPNEPNSISPNELVGQWAEFAQGQFVTKRIYSENLGQYMQSDTGYISDTSIYEFWRFSLDTLWAYHRFAANIRQTHPIFVSAYKIKDNVLYSQIDTFIIEKTATGFLCKHDAYYGTYLKFMKAYYGALPPLFWEGFELDTTYL